MSWLPLEQPNGLRLGLFLQMDGEQPAPDIYAQALELIEAAEGLGYHSARVTQHHFSERSGALPSPLPFLAAVGQRVRRIRLGTVVVTLPLEQTIRLAEEAAVTDLLLNGRLELGLGSGLSADVFTTFGADFATKSELTRREVARLQDALGGRALDGRETRLQPPNPDLAKRLWFAAMSEDGADFAAERGLGLLLGRVEKGGWSPLVNQTRTAWLYRQRVAEAGGTARIATGRTVYPATDRATARRDLAEALRPLIAAYNRSGYLPSGVPFDEVLERLHIIHGHPEEIVQTLAIEGAAIGWHELLVQLDPGELPHAKALKALERMAREVAPYLMPASPAPSVETASVLRI
jgi:alkanesulfonate monooxygenase SsuD/methylene tetrahydromethanopterin reductase-like flavin-dependent oxidoreductase (luciferase family)